MVFMRELAKVGSRRSSFSLAYVGLMFYLQPCAHWSIQSLLHEDLVQAKSLSGWCCRCRAASTRCGGSGGCLWSEEHQLRPEAASFRAGSGDVAAAAHIGSKFGVR